MVMDESVMDSLNIYVFDLGIQPKISTAVLWNQSKRVVHD